MNRTTVALVLLIAIVGMLAAPSAGTVAGSWATPGTHTTPSFAAAPHLTDLAVAPSRAAPATPAPALTFPRTVLVETFTAVWCIHCPAESSALYSIDRNTSHSVVAIAELHACAFPPGQGPCLENYVPPDGTSTVRGTYYNICGYPDVFFDGRHPSCGASNSYQQQWTDYTDKIANASAIPGNVSITQDALVGPANTVVEHANITSGLTGTYTALSYLMEFVNKTNVSNGYGPHDLAYVVRSTLIDHTVNLTAGATTSISASGALNATWNQENLSVVTFVEQNATKIVENTNMAPVMLVSTSVSPSPASVPSGASSAITVRVVNSSTGAALPGASVSLAALGGGSLSPSTGVTGTDGSLTSTFTAPTVTATTVVDITADVSRSGVIIGTGSTQVTVTPLFPPGRPGGLNITPAMEGVTLSWSPPATGGSGVTYHVYRSTSSSGGYAPVSVSTTTSFMDTGVSAGTSYWYMVDAQGPGGFSGNASPVAAVSVVASTVGLPAATGWWLAIDSAHLDSTDSAALAVHVPIGAYDYQFGSASFAFLATGSPGGVGVPDATPVQLVLSFVPNYATLQGTVSPAGATVTINGSEIQVTGGAFTETLQAGTYSLVVTSPGFVAYNKSVPLTPGNTTSVKVDLTPAPSSVGVQSNAGMNLPEIAVVGAVVVVIVAGLGGALLIRKRRRSPPRPDPEPAE